LSVLAIAMILAGGTAWALESSKQPIVLVRYNAAKAEDGYTQVTHNASNRAFLLDMESNLPVDTGQEATAQTRFHLTARAAVRMAASREMPGDAATEGGKGRESGVCGTVLVS
jgi:hypothetical protein